MPVTKISLPRVNRSEINPFFRNGARISGKLGFAKLPNSRYSKFEA